MSGILRCASPNSIPKILIFVRTKNDACKVYGVLNTAAYCSKYVGMYHASLTSQTKLIIRTDFQGNTQLRCLVATVAFGMVYFNNNTNVINILFLQGMDVGDIKVVIVYGAPNGINELHQVTIARVFLVCQIFMIKLLFI